MQRAALCRRPATYIRAAVCSPAREKGVAAAAEEKNDDGETEDGQAATARGAKESEAGEGPCSRGHRDGDEKSAAGGAIGEGRGDGGKGGVRCGGGGTGVTKGKRRPRPSAGFRAHAGNGLASDRSILLSLTAPSIFSGSSKSECPSMTNPKSKTTSLIRSRTPLSPRRAM